MGSSGNSHYPNDYWEMCVNTERLSDNMAVYVAKDAANIDIVCMSVYRIAAMSNVTSAGRAPSH